VHTTTYEGQPMSQRYPSTQSAETTLSQIDALSLSWFYNHALEIAQNRTTNLPSIDSLNIALTYDKGTETYQGITLQLMGFHVTTEANGGVHGENVLICAFQPDGTMIYMSWPTGK
jgi:hypothetical protein